MGVEGVGFWGASTRLLILSGVVISVGLRVIWRTDEGADGGWEAFFFLSYGRWPRDPFVFATLLSFARVHSCLGLTSVVVFDSDFQLSALLRKALKLGRRGTVSSGQPMYPCTPPVLITLHALPTYPIYNTQRNPLRLVRLYSIFVSRYKEPRVR